MGFTTVTFSMTTFMRKCTALICTLGGVFFIVTSQGWAMTVIRRIGFERALGSQSVRHVGDGQVLLTNPIGMFLWSIPFLAVGLVLIAASVQLWRHGKTANKV